MGCGGSCSARVPAAERKTRLGPLPGGLAMATVGACAAFGAICGSGPATTATMASVALPEMKRYGYSMQLATGTLRRAPA